MDLHIKFNIAMVIAVILAEFVSYLWYSNQTPWGRRIGDRYFISAIIFDIGLVIILQWIIQSYWRIGNIEDVLWLSVWLSLFAACLEGPHIVHDHNSLSHFFFHICHKFCIIGVMSFCLWRFRDIKI